MNKTSHLVTAALFALSITACAAQDDDTAPAAGDDIAAVTEQEVAAPAGCVPLVAIARPILAPHFHDPALTQTAGRLTLRAGDEVRTGTSIATIVGQGANGAPLGNHDWLFSDAGFRSQNDLITLKPTSDQCVFDATSEIYIVEGTGAYGGLKGTVNGVGFVNFCGGEGRIDIQGYVCP